MLKLGYISFPNINLGFRNTYLAFSPDGVSFTSRKKVLTAFNVSCGIRLKDGTIALYGEDFVRNPDKIIVNPTTGFKITDLAVAVSEDGEQFERGELSIKNLTRNIQGADSAVVQLPDGRYRLYFVDNNNKEMFSALSNDGYDFTFEGKVDDIHMADPEIMYGLGLACSLTQQYEQQIWALKKAILEKPDFAEAYYLLGVGYSDLGCGRLAIKAFTRAVQLKPDHAKANFRLGLAYLSDHNEVLARKQYEILKSLDLAQAKKLKNFIKESASSTEDQA